jgi:hypothetical protein
VASLTLLTLRVNVGQNRGLAYPKVEPEKELRGGACNFPAGDGNGPRRISPA